MKTVCRDSHGGRSRRPHTHLGGPEGGPTWNDELLDLWYWAWARGQDAALQPPLRLHGAYPTAEDTRDRPLSLLDIGQPRRKSKSAVIVGRPFTREFERFLDDVKPMTPIRRALFAMKPKDTPAPTVVQILWAIVEGGHSEPEVVCALLNLELRYFEYLALVGLRRLEADTLWVERNAAA